MLELTECGNKTFERKVEVVSELTSLKMTTKNHFTTVSCFPEQQSRNGLGIVFTAVKRAARAQLLPKINFGDILTYKHKT